jgi:CRP/FNR family cyclic AMP-dependent transcriptional regulator
VFNIEQRRALKGAILLAMQRLGDRLGGRYTGSGMIEINPELDQFKEQMRGSLLGETKDTSALLVGKHKNVYAVGDKDEAVYFIESGQIKLMISCEGRDCMLAIHGPGDVFGEMCLSAAGGRLETATAMEETSLKTIRCAKFLERLAEDSLLEGFVKYLAARVADQQVVIANLVTADSEQRLGKTLLHLARKLGKDDPRSIRIELEISHDELASMVGTTRSRIGVFMQRFENLGLIEFNSAQHLIIKESKLTAYLSSIA